MAFWAGSKGQNITCVSHIRIMGMAQMGQLSIENGFENEVIHSFSSIQLLHEIPTALSLANVLLQLNSYDLKSLVESTRNLMDIVAGNGHGDRSSNPLGEAVRISHSANTFGKDMNPSILPRDMSKIVEQTSLCMATGVGEGKLWNQPVQFCIKIIVCRTLFIQRGQGNTNTFSNYSLLLEPIRKSLVYDWTVLFDSLCPRGVMVKAMDSGIVVSEFVLQSRYYVHFRANTLGKGMNSLIHPAVG